MRAFLQSPYGDELTFLVKHHEALSLSRGMSAWWPAFADGPPNHLQPLATAATSLLFVLHRALSVGLGVGASTAVGLFNFLLFAAGLSVLANALARSMFTYPSSRQSLRVAATTAIAALALFTTGNSGEYNPFTMVAAWGWFPAFIALALVLRLTAGDPPSAWRWAAASILVSAFYGPAVIILVAGVVAHRTTLPLRQCCATAGRNITTLLAASTGLLADIAWTVVYRKVFGGSYEGVMPAQFAELPQSFIGSIASNLNGLDSIRFSLIARVGLSDVFLAALVSATLLLSWRTSIGWHTKASSKQDPASPSPNAKVLLRISALLAIGAGLPFVASARYARTAFSPPTFQYFNSVFLMVALIALLATLISQRPESGSQRFRTVVGIGALVLISSANLSQRADEIDGAPPAADALDLLVAGHAPLTCSDLAPLFLDRNGGSLAQALTSASTARHGSSPCPPYSDNYIRTIHLIGGSSAAEFDQQGWWFWLGSGDVTFRLELSTTEFTHVDIPLFPAECVVSPFPRVSAEPGRLLGSDSVRLTRNLFEVSTPDFAIIEFTLRPESHACLLDGDSRPLSVRVGMPVLAR